ncbi:MAG: 2-succinyl-6-hydroxy-2,4-cyclohexadiene-1-carboxylate synthase [Chloroflexi bacterium]|nr:2-succinyl-6-hydroxy-2,4-cyclohexadiene-1-carboxylate synthase [Chloroflexota bacterium]
MAIVTVNGVRLNVETSGAGPPILAIHGFTGSAATWEPFVASARRSYTVVAVDMLGHGASAAPQDPARYEMKRCIEDLDCLLDLLGLRRVHWLGYSMGGRIALAAALALPHRTASLIVESGSPGLATSEEREERVRRDRELADWIETVGIERFVEYWENLPLFASHARLPDATRERLRRQRLQNSPTGLANSLRGIGTGVQPPLHARLPSLSAPALFIAGEEDQRFAAIGRAMHRVVPQSRLYAIPGAGHTPHLEQSEEFNRAVLEFLSGLPSQGVRAASSATSRPAP